MHRGYRRARIFLGRSKKKLGATTFDMVEGLRRIKGEVYGKEGGNTVRTTVEKDLRKSRDMRTEEKGALEIPRL